MSYTCEYRIYKSIVQRCTNPKLPYWKNYGGRGIRIYEPWRKSFQAFFEYVGPRPSKHHSLDRIDNDRGYEPGNVRWATRMQQARNAVRRSEELRRLLCEAALGHPTYGNVACEAVTAAVRAATPQGVLVVLDLGNGDVRVAYYVAPNIEHKDRCVLRMFDAPFDYERQLSEREELVAVDDK